MRRVSLRHGMHVVGQSPSQHIVYMFSPFLSLPCVNLEIYRGAVLQVGSQALSCCVAGWASVSQACRPSMMQRPILLGINV